MAAKLAQYFELVEKKGGLAAKMKLAMKTGVSSEKARTEPDSPENLAKFYEAAKETLGPETPRL